MVAWSMSSSSWGDAQIGQRIDSVNDLPLSDRFALRLISLPAPKAGDEELLQRSRIN